MSQSTSSEGLKLKTKSPPSDSNMYEGFKVDCGSVIQLIFAEMLSDVMAQSSSILIQKHQSHRGNVPSAQRYLHGSVDSGVGSQAEVGSRHVVADGGRDHTHGYTELIVATPGLKQLQHTFVRL